MRNRIGRLNWMTAMLVALCADLPANDDVDPDDPDAQAAQVQQAQFEVSEDNFEQWVFGGGRNLSAGRQRLEIQLKLQLEAVDRVCELNDGQKKKLMLAGRGDLKRFWDEYEVIRQKFLLVRKDQQKFNEIWQDIQPLQMTLASGMFRDDSLFHKTVYRTLNSEQSERYQAAEVDRRTARYHAKLELLVATLEAQMPLKHEQREKLLQTLREETKPPARSAGQYEYYAVLYLISKVPEAKLKPLFDAAQWKIVQANLQQGRGMEQFLKQNGLMPDGTE